MSDRDYERWLELQERLEAGSTSAGATLSAAEREFCARMVASNPLCAREDVMLQELAHLEGPPDAGAREREDAVLAAVWGETESSHEAHVEAGHAEATRASVVTFRSRTFWKLSATLVAAAAVALTVGSGIGYWRRSGTTNVEAQASRVELVYSSGDVRIDTQSAAFGQLLSEGSIVQVNDGAACLAIDPGIDVCLGKHSKLRVTHTKVADRRVDLLAGDVTASIDPQPVGARFSIVADKVWSTAVGTAFSVSRDKDGTVHTVVLNGKVLVGPQNKQQTVSAHQRAKVEHDKTSVSAMARADESPYWAAIKTTELWRDPKTATLIVSDEHERASLWLNGEEIGVSPLSSLIPAGEHRLTTVLRDGTSFERTFMIAAGKTWSLDLAAELNAQLNTQRKVEAFKARVNDSIDLTPVHSTSTRPSVAVAPASELLALARQQLRQSQWDAAATTYRTLRSLHGESAEGKTVLVSLAQLSMEHLGQPAVALADVETYLAEGGGALTQEARHLRIQALRALGKDNVAREAARAFLDDYPQSFQAETLRRELATTPAHVAAPTQPE